MTTRLRKGAPIVVLFEDDKERAETLRGKISASLGGTARVVSFVDEKAAVKGTIEEMLASSLQAKSYHGGNIGLIVCDRALERYDKFQITSETVVSAVARQLGIPICLYERGGRKDELRLENRKPWEKSTIIVDETGEDFGQQCAALYLGFEEIKRFVLAKSDSAFRKTTPAVVLADILRHPQEVDRLGLYGSGEQSVLSELLTHYASEGNTKDLRLRHYPRMLGNWLYTSILRYPGILVGTIPAASYLNVHPDDLLSPRISKLFEKATYRGPFARCGQWWWRRDLDQILAGCGGASHDYLKKRGAKRFRPYPCFEGKDHTAGFYCMISGKPVCERHSRGGISWFPGGADLARVSEREFKKIGPFVGLY